MKNRYINLVSRLIEIDWEKIHSNGQYVVIENKFSYVVLVKEYLRRMTLFLNAISSDAKLPYVDAALVSGKDITIDLATVNERLSLLKGTFCGFFCYSILKWALLSENGDSLAVQFSDVYEPLIKLYERGGWFRIHNGQIFVGESSFGLRSKTLNEADISDIALDKYDSM